MAARPLTWLDVFTARPLTGNGLAVVHDADDVDEPTMLAFARETRLSETTFVQSATDPGADYRNRIWMTTGELPFAGHPSLGTAVAVARQRGERRGCYVQQTRSGLQPIDVEVHDDRLAFASMLQEPATFGDELDRCAVAAALGLDSGDLHPTLAPQAVSAGVGHVLVIVDDEGALGRARPTFDALAELLRAQQAITAYLAAVDGQRVEARAWFAQRDAVVEDPATGSAAGPLCAYLQVRTGVDRLEISQGVAMGRPSRLLCEAGERVRVGGDVVVVADGVVQL